MNHDILAMGKIKDPNWYGDRRVTRCACGKKSPETVPDSFFAKINAKPSSWKK
jgi:hypothetical protein